MCGRFSQQLTSKELHHLYSLPGPIPLLNLRPRYNGAPTQDFAVCRLNETNRRTIVRLRWGLVPSWAKDIRIGTHLFNARAETVHFKPSFRAAFRSRRCLVPANGWFEWKRTAPVKQPWFVALANGSPLSFAALWERWNKAGEPIESFTIITTTTSPALAHIHERQPVVISPDHFTQWLNPDSPLPQLLDLMRRPCASPFVPHEVGTRVNHVANDDPGIIDSLP